MKGFFHLVILGLMFSSLGNCLETLDLEVISYDAFMEEDRDAITTLRKALHEQGIVGIKGIPGYKETAKNLIETARVFSAFPEEVKEKYAPKPGDVFSGYERGKEKFMRPDGTWLIDDLKASYYGWVPDHIDNKWPDEVELRTPFEEMGALMAEMGTLVLEKMKLIGPPTGIYLEGVPRLGRMLYYSKKGNDSMENPYWCGAHFDHGLFTVLIPAAYFKEGEQVDEPKEAGLFVKETGQETFRKVVANDPEVMFFQVGEFGQLVSNDGICATEHRVHKALGDVERYTMAVFFNPSMETVIHSTSILTEDSRYGGKAGSPCTYCHWNEESFKRYIVD